MPTYLITDVDHTLTGDDGALARFADWHGAQRGRVKLVYNSGRFAASVLATVEATALPEPEAIIGGVGTEICLAREFQPLIEWRRSMRAWSADRVREALETSGEERGAAKPQAAARKEDFPHSPLATRHPPLIPQPAEFCSDYKVSYYAHDLTPDQLAAIERRLREAGLRANVVYSSRRDLDILPAGVDKGTAAEFLRAHWGLRRDQIIVCGDSGNDCALFAQNFRGIVVGNGHDDLKELAGKPSNGKRIYLANSPHAAGVMEGLEHWQTASW